MKICIFIYKKIICPYSLACHDKLFATCKPAYSKMKFESRLRVKKSKGSHKSTLHLGTLILKS